MRANKWSYLFIISGLLTFLDTYSQDTVHTIRVVNLEGINGDLYIGWYTNPADFRINEKAVHRRKIEVKNLHEVDVLFNNIPKGSYAIAVFLDENANYQLDRNFFGMPTEKYGFSNNVLPALRPATFQESVFELREDGSLLTIKVK